MFANSIVSPDVLAYFRERTQKALTTEKLIDPKLRPIIELFAEHPHIATAWCSQGHVRVENGKRRTRHSHHMIFVADKLGYGDIEKMYQYWQESPNGELMHLTLSRLRYPADFQPGYYPSWRFQLSARPEPDVIDRACATWLRIAQAL